MNKLLIFISCIVLLTACGGGSNEDGSSQSTYSSCKVVSSGALLQSDVQHDLKQCWNAPKNGFNSQGDALQWCESQVQAYKAKRYVVGHSIKYAVESTYCPAK